MFKANRLALAVAAVSLSAGVFAAPAGTLATVNGVAIPAARADLFVKDLAQRGQKDTPELRAKVKDELIKNEVVYQEALKKGVEKNPDLIAQMEMMKQRLVIGAFVSQYVKANPITDAEVRKEYDKIKVNFGGKEYKARHILVATEPEANAILADLKKGKKFEDLAKDKSMDKGSGSNGGDLGWANPNNFVKEFSEAMTKMPKGKISEKAVKTQFGFHIIKVDDVRDAKGPSYEEVKPQLEQQMQAQRIQKMVEDLVAKAKIAE
ncbi:peptidylprolyl isomerase [Chitinibacter bivalviorum]|uniref:peptidylprolyl isomerase n=1 Tax=Chitinibacter bivalviorum TaxID=2739434 RepID=A0A7H9BIT6_9NEIS|nr:peptidylprolyl isomerase [Chitinibacter bivalviorum]QLG88389.1 peptidylprolyl isomerase [Chitinibacter bivalviorum]